MTISRLLTTHSSHIGVNISNSAEEILWSIPQISLLDHIGLIENGAPAGLVSAVAKELDLPKDTLYAALHLPRSTIERKTRESKRLSSPETERVLGLVSLINQAEEIFVRAGAEGDSKTWMANWLNSPYAPLGGRKPLDLMNTDVGRALVSDLLAQMESGAYA